MTPLYDVLSVYPLLGEGPGKLSPIGHAWPWRCGAKCALASEQNCAATGKLLERATASCRPKGLAWMR